MEGYVDWMICDCSEYIAMAFGAWEVQHRAGKACIVLHEMALERVEEMSVNRKAAHFSS